MAYLDTRPMTPARLSSIGIVVVIHAAVLYALVTGGYKQVIDTVVDLRSYNVPLTVPPEPIEPLPTLPKQAQAPSKIMTPKTVIEVPTSTPTELSTTPTPPDTPYSVLPTPAPTPIITPFPTAPPVTTTPEPSALATRAKLLRGGTISNDDYPPAAIRAEEQGRSTATYTVDASGRVSSCSAAGAGPILDAETCKLIQRRFRFTAAKDASGAPVAETKTQSIEWRLPR